MPHMEEFEKQRFAVWFANANCNMTCDYCWQHDEPLPANYGRAATARSLKTLRPDHPVGLEYDAILQSWLKAWNKLKPTVIDITGGEPLILPWMVDFIAQVPVERVAITTNMTGDLAGMIRKVPPEKVVVITASWHPTQKLSLEDFTGKCLMMKHRGFPVNVNFVTWPEQVHLLDYYREWFQRFGLYFHVDPFAVADAQAARAIVPTRSECELVASLASTERQVHPWTEKYGRDYQVRCDAGIRHFCVQPNGDVWRCLTFFVHKLPPMGNLFDDQFELPTSKLPCSLHHSCAGCDRDKVLVELIS